MAVEIYENVISKEQVKELLEVRDRDKKVMNFGEIRDRVAPHFKDFFSTFGIDVNNTSGRYFYTLRPFSTHSDGLSSDNGSKPSNINVLIPLELEPAGTSSYTVFFDQLDETPMHGRKFYKKEIPWHGNPKPIETDYSILKNITDEPFDKEIYDKYLSYMDYGDFHGLTFHKAVKWKMGDAIKFESNRLHCSSDFQTKGITSKTHLFFKMYIPE